MMNSGYSQEQSVNFLRIQDNKVFILIRNIEKELEATPGQIEDIKRLDFFIGEKITLLYSSKVEWELKKYTFPDSSVDKYLRSG